MRDRLRQPRSRRPLTSDLRPPRISTLSFLFSNSRANARSAFTLIELLVVMGIIAIALAFLIPTLGPSSGRALDAATGQFRADMEGARLIAIAERTRTRVLVPINSNNFTAPTSAATPWPNDIALRGYLVVSKITETNGTVGWRSRGKWSRLPDGIAFDPTGGLFTQPAPAPVPTPPGIPIDVGGSGTASYTFNGPYIEFLANGSCNLDPAATPAPAATIADGFVNASGIFVQKNQRLRFTVAVDPLTGSVSVK